MFTPPSASARYRALQAVLVAGIPLAVIACFLSVQSKHSSQLSYRSANSPPPLLQEPATRRIVVVAVDGLSGAMAQDKERMPTMVRLARGALHGPLSGCTAAEALPCLLTALEGRQSAYHPTIDAFASDPREEMGWPRAARGKGLRVKAIAAGPLPNLYPGAWSEVVRLDALEPLTDAAISTLQKQDTDALIIQLPHHTDASNVDRALARISGQLTTDDHLLVFGTYGLDTAGAPARDTWYVATGPRLTSARLALDQVAIAFLLSRLSGVPLGENYEGELRWELLSDEQEQQWRSELADAWEQPQVGRRDLSLALERRQDAVRTRPARDIGAFVPWLLHIILIGGAIASSFAGEIRLRQTWLAWQVAWLTASLIWPDEAPWLALIVQIFVSWPRAGGWGGVPALILWGVLAFGTGVAMPQIEAIFGTEFAGPTSVLVWYFLVGGVPLLISAFTMNRLGARSRWSRAALVALGSLAILPPPGSTYFSAAQCVTRSLYPLLCFVILMEARPKRWSEWLLLLFLLSGSAFGIIDNENGGWTARPLSWFDSMTELGRIIAIGSCIVVMTGIWWTNRGVSKALLGALTFIGFAYGSHTLFGMPLSRVAALSWLHLALAAGLELLRSPVATGMAPSSSDQSLAVDIGPDDRIPGVTIRSAWQVALTLSTAFIALWVATGGPYLTNLNLDPLVSHFSVRFSDQWLVAIAVLGWSAFGWSLVVFMSPLILLTTLRSERLVALGRWAMLLVSFKILAQGLQFLGVRLVETIKWSEVLLQETLAVGVLALLLWTSLLMVALYRHTLQWLIGRDRVY